MDFEDKNIIMLIFVAICSMFVGMCFGLSIAEHHWKQNAIEVGVGQYNPTNGNFEWKTNQVTQ